MRILLELRKVHGLHLKSYCDSVHQDELVYLVGRFNFEDLSFPFFGTLGLQH